MKHIISILFLFFLPLIIYGQENNRWFIEKADGKSGFIDSTGTEIFTGKYEMLGQHYNSGLVLFKRNGKWGYLDVNGKVIFYTDNFGQFSEGLLASEKKGKYVYLDTKGKTAISLENIGLPKGKKISKIFSFSCGLAMIIIKDIGFNDESDANSDVVYSEDVNLYPGNWYYGFINNKGEWQIPPTLSSATSFIEGVSMAANDSISFFMDTKGQVITVLNCHIGEIWTEVGSDASDYSEGFAIVYDKDGNSVFINLKGQRLTETKFERANPFSDGMACVQLEDAWGFIDSTGNIRIPPKYYVRSDFSEGVAPVSLKIDETGYFLNSYFIEGFINKVGETVIPFQPHVDYAGFKNGLTKGRRFIHENKKYTGYYELFYMNRKGEKVWSEIVKQ
jgi:hypothetical protein